MKLTNLTAALVAAIGMAATAHASLIGHYNYDVTHYRAQVYGNMVYFDPGAGLNSVCYHLVNGSPNFVMIISSAPGRRLDEYTIQKVLTGNAESGAGWKALSYDIVGNRRWVSTDGRLYAKLAWANDSSGEFSGRQILVINYMRWIENGQTRYLIDHLAPPSEFNTTKKTTQRTQSHQHAHAQVHAEPETESPKSDIENALTRALQARHH